MTTQYKLARLKELPPLPVLLLEALKCTADTQNLSLLADKVSQDPPLVVRILRIANSPFYGMPREIGSLREAIVLLGINRVRELVLSICVLKILPAQNKNFNYPLFWHHSLQIADCTRQLAKHVGIAQDIAFTAGLLHDIGRIVMVLLFPDEYARLIKVPEFNTLDMEKQYMGNDHVEFGSQVAQFWNLPIAIQQAIDQHETPATPSAGSVSLGQLIYTANSLVKTVDQTFDKPPVYSNNLVDIFECLHISHEQATDWAGTSRQFADQILSIA